MALTSKIENPIRDEVAFHLYDKYDNNYIISREWANKQRKGGSRRDIAILDTKNNPVLFFEFKNCYSFDLMLKGKILRYIRDIKDDFEKAKKSGNGKTKIYEVLIVIHPKTVIDDNFERVIKYNNQINRALKKNEEDKITKIGNKNFRKYANQNNLNINDSGSIIDDGKAFGVKCSIYYFILTKK